MLPKSAFRIAQGRCLYLDAAQLLRNIPQTRRGVVVACARSNHGTTGRLTVWLLKAKGDAFVATTGDQPP